MSYEWSFGTVWAYREALIQGTIVTVHLTAISLLFGSSLGVIFAWGRMSTARWIAWPVGAVVEVLRALPLLVLLVWIYYCLPILTGLRLSAYATAVLALSLNMAAFAAEIFRAGVEAIPRGFVEAARAVGMTAAQAFRKITFPQAARSMLPALVGLSISVLKLSSLASAISVFELLHSSNDVITRTFRPLEIYTSVALIYLVLVLPPTLLSRRWETSALLRERVPREG